MLLHIYWKTSRGSPGYTRAITTKLLCGPRVQPQSGDFAHRPTLMVMPSPTVSYFTVSKWNSKREKSSVFSLEIPCVRLMNHKFCILNEILNLKDLSQKRNYIDGIKREKEPLNKKGQVSAFLVPAKPVLSCPINCEGWPTNLKTLGSEVRKMWPGKCQAEETTGMPVPLSTVKEFGLLFAR